MPKKSKKREKTKPKKKLHKVVTLRKKKRLRKTKNSLRGMGPRPVMQIVPPRDVVRPAYVRKADDDKGHELVSRPLASPTGPGGAAGWRNVAGSQIAVPKVTNIYMGPFWGDRAFVEGFSKAIVENGYLDPLKELNYGTGPGTYAGAVDGSPLAANSVFKDSDAQAVLKQMLGSGQITGDANSLFALILPDGVTGEFDSDGSESCSAWCGYHDSFDDNGIQIAYMVLPSTLCKPCGGQIGDFTAVYAHELAEACTDKVPGQGWVAGDGEENGDLEAWILFGWGPPEDPKRYTIQGYYTAERGNTVGAWRNA